MGNYKATMPTLNSRATFTQCNLCYIVAKLLCYTTYVYYNTRDQQVHATNTEKYMAGKSLTDSATLQGELLYYCITHCSNHCYHSDTLEYVLLP